MLHFLTDHLQIWILSTQLLRRFNTFCLGCEKPLCKDRQYDILSIWHLVVVLQHKPIKEGKVIEVQLEQYNEVSAASWKWIKGLLGGQCQADTLAEVKSKHVCLALSRPTWVKPFDWLKTVSCTQFDWSGTSIKK